MATACESKIAVASFQIKLNLSYINDRKKENLGPNLAMILNFISSISHHLNTKTCKLMNKWEYEKSITSSWQH